MLFSSQVISSHGIFVAGNFVALYFLRELFRCMVFSSRVISSHGIFVAGYFAAWYFRRGLFRWWKYHRGNFVALCTSITRIDNSRGISQNLSFHIYRYIPKRRTFIMDQKVKLYNSHSFEAFMMIWKYYHYKATHLL